MSKFEVYEDRAGEFRFRLKASNGEIILTSEGYSTKASCENGIASVRKNAQQEASFEKLENNSGQPYFNLKAENNKVIGNSESYTSASARDNGIYSVMNNAPNAPLNYV